MREFASAVVEPTGKMAEECTALRAMCAMLEGFLAGQQGRDVDMIALVGEFLDAHKVWRVGFLAREAFPSFTPARLQGCPPAPACKVSVACQVV